MKTKISRYAWGPTFILLTILFACAPRPQAPDKRELTLPAQNTKGGLSESPSSAASSQSTQLPVRFQTPTYAIGESQNLSDVLGSDEEYVVKVGADISSTSGPVVLREIMKKLAALKNMNVSWASDVDQYSYVDVDIRSEDDFFKSIDNLLRQRDYFHEVQGNTIVIKYKETKKFHLAMPFVNSKYDASVGSKVSQDSQSTITNSGNSFDIWDNVKKNLDTVLQIWEEKETNVPAPPTEPVVKVTNGQVNTSAMPLSTYLNPEKATQTPATATTTAANNNLSRPQSAKGYYTIDRPIGLITVTAPRPIMEKVESYISNLQGELYKQVSIEAKILEVTVTDSSEEGINWSSLFSDNTAVGITGIFEGGARTFTISSPINFSLLLKALEKQGKTKILSNPRLSVMNGQPAMINVGRQITYIKKITVTQAAANSGSGPTTAAETEEKTSGLVMSIVPTILDNNEIILNLIPVTSTVAEPIPIQSVGIDGGSVGLPVTTVREMSTMIKVKQGEMLVVGGLINTTDSNDDSKVSVLGHLPFVGKLFGVDNKSKARTELVILLKPQIIS